MSLVLDLHDRCCRCGYLNGRCRCEPRSLEDYCLTPREAARCLGISGDTLRRWARAGKVSAARTATGHRRYSAAEVSELAAALETEDTP